MENTRLWNKDCKHRRNTRNVVLYKCHLARGSATLQPPATTYFIPGLDKLGGGRAGKFNFKAVKIENRGERQSKEKDDTQGGNLQNKTGID